MKQKKSMNLGFRGWMLIIHLFCAFMAFIVFTNWPMNILADMYGGAATISTIYTGCIILGIVLQLILSMFVGKIKSIKKIGTIFGVIAIILAFCIMVVPPTMLGMWRVCYGMEWNVCLQIFGQHLLWEF